MAAARRAMLHFPTRAPLGRAAAATARYHLHTGFRDESGARARHLTWFEEGVLG
jgi:hypothetical protein